MKNKLIIECPICHTVHEVSMGLFHKRKVDCACGHSIPITDKMYTTKQCKHCGNIIMYDRVKDKDPVCPVCHEHILGENDQYKFTEVICPECNLHFTVDKNEYEVECPLCGHEINVHDNVEQQDLKKENQPLLIQKELDNDVCIYKHYLTNFPLGSQVIVNESEVALLVTDGSGKPLSIFLSGRYTIDQDVTYLSKENYDDKNKVFSSQIYFINNTIQTNMKWGTDTKIRMFDPASGLHLELGAFGYYSFKIVDCSKLLFHVLGLGTISSEGLTAQELSFKIKPSIVKVVKSELARQIRDNAINILEVDEHLDIISKALLEKINVEMRSFGIEIVDFMVSNILTPDDDPNFARLKEQYAERYLKVNEERIGQQVASAHRDRVLTEVGTENEVELARAKARAEIERIKAEANADSYMTKAQAEAAEMRMKGFTYNDETNRQVAINQANSVKTMIENPTWNCPNCGKQGISSKFCPECGTPKPIEEWDCPECGTKGIKSKFCPNCGHKK